MTSIIAIIPIVFTPFVLITCHFIVRATTIQYQITVKHDSIHNILAKDLCSLICSFLIICVIIYGQIFSPTPLYDWITLLPFIYIYIYLQSVIIIYRNCLKSALITILVLLSVLIYLWYQSMEHSYFLFGFLPPFIGFGLIRSVINILGWIYQDNCDKLLIIVANLEILTMVIFLIVYHLIYDYDWSIITAIITPIIYLNDPSSEEVVTWKEPGMEILYRIPIQHTEQITTTTLTNYPNMFTILDHNPTTNKTDEEEEETTTSEHETSPLINIPIIPTHDVVNSPQDNLGGNVGVGAPHLTTTTKKKKKKKQG
jgi:hypothetical protein